MNRKDQGTVSAVAVPSPSSTMVSGPTITSLNAATKST